MMKLFSIIALFVAVAAAQTGTPQWTDSPGDTGNTVHPDETSAHPSNTEGSGTGTSGHGGESPSHAPWHTTGDPMDTGIPDYAYSGYPDETSDHPWHSWNTEGPTDTSSDGGERPSHAPWHTSGDPLGTFIPEDSAHTGYSVQTNGPLETDIPDQTSDHPWHSWDTEGPGAGAPGNGGERPSHAPWHTTGDPTAPDSAHTGPPLQTWRPGKGPRPRPTSAFRTMENRRPGWNRPCPKGQIEYSPIFKINDLKIQNSTAIPLKNGSNTTFLSPKRKGPRRRLIPGQYVKLFYNSTAGPSVSFEYGTTECNK